MARSHQLCNLAIKNCLTSCAIPGETPYSLVHKSKPNLAQAHDFGGILYAHFKVRGKLEAQADEAMFVGIDEESKGYWIYWSEKRCVSIECNVTFMLMTITVAVNDLDVGELVHESTPQAVQPAAPPVQTPLPVPPVTPPRPSQPLPQLTAP